SLSVCSIWTEVQSSRRVAAYRRGGLNVERGRSPAARQCPFDANVDPESQGRLRWDRGGFRSLYAPTTVRRLAVETWVGQHVPGARSHFVPPRRRAITRSSGRDAQVHQRRTEQQSTAARPSRRAFQGARPPLRRARQGKPW